MLTAPMCARARLPHPNGRSLPERGNCLEQIVVARAHHRATAGYSDRTEICHASFPFSEVNVCIKHADRTERHAAVRNNESNMVL